jgi:hypothetical protein
MKYEKPELLVLDAACAAIQGTTKDGLTTEFITHQPTVAAYEADE